jgi:hypothetical protein
MHDRMARAIKERGISMSKLIRDALVQHLNHWDATCAIISDATQPHPESLQGPSDSAEGR